ncbi:c-type cytochrome [Desulfovibrio gilichinskyi]|uniref:Cytochrome C oxidase, cbb3-type, subunit III n=1 Tax=Desulfovibrio gilichinskyi TaxID=1519643 RepID=A0A1X7E7K6_9BACT|nr:cytochrome c [Desulfovibrio gilichinskyi]SMF28786.1 Cytochrome C oxidase, cbb3-type, subunit III [Desulfovibrio gilichinskyi]
MKQWTDLFLTLPLSEGWLRFLLFVSFGLHLLFVLLMLGTAMLGFVFFLQRKFPGDREGLAWNQRLIKSHLGLKSLAVVLGVAPLLIIQVISSMGFFTATGLFAYTWLSIIPLLIFAFLSIELFERKMLATPWIPFLCGVLGVGALLTVPAVFTGALSLMERPELWAEFGAKKLSLSSIYMPHWLFRYLHVLGAALVFGAAFHLFFSKGDKLKNAKLQRWLLGGTLFQVAVGVPLLFTIADVFNWPVLTAVTLGVIAAVFLIWTLRPSCAPAEPRGWGILILLPVIFVSMLTARQSLQDITLTRLHNEAVTSLKQESANLDKYREQALKTFKTKLATVYDNGATIYSGSCQPCHGAGGMGNGTAGRKLLIKAEDLTAIRAEKTYIRSILLTGIDGSGMPYFTVFDGEKIDSLLAEMDKRFAMFKQVTIPDRTVSDESRQVWKETCATCHGQKGEVSDFGQTLRPAPPNLQRYSLEPDRAFKVISEGYSGTVMQPYRALPENTRLDLVTLMGVLRHALILYF